MNNDYIVSIVKCDDYGKAYEAFKNALEPLGGIEKFVSKGAKVAIKPNLLMASKPETGCTTHPEAVRAVIKLVKAAGGIPKLVESPGGPNTQLFVKGVFNACGMTKMAAEEAVEISFDMQTVPVEVPNGKNLKKVQILKALAEADVIINMPKPKPHGMMVYTGAVKNMFGAIAGTTKMDYHFRQSNYEDFANSIIDIFLATKTTLNLMDGIVTMHKKGPSSGDPIKTGFLMAGANAFAVDSVALEILKADRKKVYIIEQGIQRGLCPENILDIQVFFEGQVLYDLKPAMIDGYVIPMVTERKMMEIFSKMPKWLEFIVRARPVFSRKKCKRCNICVQSCPAKCLSFEPDVKKVATKVLKAPAVDLEKCIRCYCCEELCPAKAVDINRFIF